MRHRKPLRLGGETCGNSFRYPRNRFTRSNYENHVPESIPSPSSVSQAFDGGHHTVSRCARIRPEQFNVGKRCRRAAASVHQHDRPRSLGTRLVIAKCALASGDDPDGVIRQIVWYRATDKSSPGDYSRRAVTKAQAELSSKHKESELPDEQGNRERDA